MKLIILDRDGVINQDPKGYISHPDDWHPYPGSLEAIAKLSQAGFILTILSNQSGIGRGYFNEEALTAVHQKMLELIQTGKGKIDKIYYCPHHPDAGCACRKPGTKLIEQMQADFHVTPDEMIFIGDSHSDIQAALNAKCQPMLVLTGYGQKTLAENPGLSDTKTFADLHEAANYIIKQEYR